MSVEQEIKEVNDSPLTLTLTLDDGSELTCEVIGSLEHGGKEYIAVLPEGEENFWIYEYRENEDDTLEIDNIDDEDLFAEIGKSFEELFSEEDGEEHEEHVHSEDCDHKH